jgi:endonuclease YncB( thermonuclease family)
MSQTTNFLTAKQEQQAAFPPLVRDRRNERFTTIMLMVIAFFISTAVGSVVLGIVPLRLPQITIGKPEPVAVRGYLVSFPICAGSSRETCVVDGDTFWLEGTKYRVADIDTPEVGDPACAAEAKLGREATERLALLLNAGPFHLDPADRDEDVYGRKLRIVTRGGESLGMRLVDEGLAHAWDGGKHGWC